MSVRDRGDSKNLAYDFRYQPTYERFFAVRGNTNAGDVSGLDHSALGDFAWRIDPATTLAVDGSFFRQRRLRQEFADVPSVPDQTLDANDDEYVQRGRGSVSLRRSISSRTFVSGTYAYDNFDVSQQDRSDSTSHTISVGFNRSLGSKTTVGAAGTARLRATKSSIDPDGALGIQPITEFRSTTRTTDLSFTVARQLSEDLELSATAGPSFFDTRDEESNGAVSYSSDQSFFAALRGSYRWRHGDVELAYTRSEAGGGGSNAASSIVDDVSLNVVHRPAREWVLRAGASWNHRSSISSNAFFGLDTRVDRISVFGSALYQVNPRLALIARIRFNTQETDEYRPAQPGFGIPLLERSTTTESVQGVVSIRYTFDPFVF